MTLILHGHQPPDDPLWQVRLGLTKSKSTGRSWWSCRYTDGTIINEWDSDPGSPNKHVDWPRIRKRGMQKLRLYYPTGQLSELGDTRDSGGRFFQFKVSIRLITAGFGARGLVNHDLGEKAVLAHVIGMVDSFNGECQCFAWEPLPMPDQPKQPKIPDPDDEYYLTGRPGLLADHYERYKNEMQEYRGSPEFIAWVHRVEQWNNNARGQINMFRDNVYTMKYMNVGKLGADHLGLNEQ